jgi:hypothetical protein
MKEIRKDILTIIISKISLKNEILSNVVDEEFYKQSFFFNRQK